MTADHQPGQVWNAAHVYPAAHAVVVYVGLSTEVVMGVGGEAWEDV